MGGNFVRLLDRATNKKRPKSLTSTHGMATIFTDLTLKIFDHIRAKNRPTVSIFTCATCLVRLLTQFMFRIVA